MKVFIAVADSGSFSATADKLEMSRAMVTRYVNELEQWLNARLLHRTTRSVTLTDAGESCMRRSQQILGLMENIEEETCSQDGVLFGQLRVTCSVSLACTQMANAIVDFLKLHPKLKIDLIASEDALNLVEARIDLAVRISSEPDPTLIGRVLAPCTSVLVASPAYLAAHGTPSVPSDLSRHQCLTYDKFVRSFWTLHQDKEICRIPVSSHFNTNEATTLLRAILAGGGIAFQPTYLANRYLADGTLQHVLPNWKIADMSIYALYPSRRHLSPAVRTFLDFLASRFLNVAWM